MKKIRLLFTILLLTVFLVACGLKSEVTQETHLEIGKDKSVTSHIREPFAEVYYSIDELNESINDSFEEYNIRLNSANAIKLVNSSLSDQMVLLDIDYASSKDFENFDGYQLFVGEIFEAVALNYPLQTVLVSVEDSTSTIAEADIKAMDKANILITDYENLIYLPSKILYASDNCVVDNNSVILKSGSTGLIYVIYK